MEMNQEREKEVREAWRRLKENQSKRREKLRRDITNIKTIFLFILVIIIFVVFYFLIQLYIKEDTYIKSKRDDLIRIELKDIEQSKEKSEDK
jgi:cell division protein FtsL